MVESSSRDSYCSDRSWNSDTTIRPSDFPGNADPKPEVQRYWMPYAAKFKRQGDDKIEPPWNDLLLPAGIQFGWLLRKDPNRTVWQPYDPKNQLPPGWIAWIYHDLGRIKWFDVTNHRLCIMHPTGRFATEGLPQPWEAAFYRKPGDRLGRVCYINNDRDTVSMRIPAGYTFVEGVGFMSIVDAQRKLEEGTLKGRILVGKELRYLRKHQVLRLHQVDLPAENRNAREGSIKRCRSLSSLPSLRHDKGQLYEELGII
ncbi:hypothetical protein CAC42_1931 [Sphaceloma murrayae]|uniref:Uncharacterized protein n=1 Tax=Sphaceloma murrayae TaxID=2082308 RepID=A0A2K1QLZ5_9PEZI|nr:hypothetical protein CAC42_1931 [Sphaceloma murrayae]